MKVLIETNTVTKSESALRASALYQTIKSMTPTEIRAWIDRPTFDMDDVKNALTILLLALKKD